LKKKNPSQKRAGVVAQSAGPEFKPQHQNEKKMYMHFTSIKKTNKKRNGVVS
jgi:hypothetical protein